jgi:tetratricopeptide (TPR) repeat protein
MLKIAAFGAVVVLVVAAVFAILSVVRESRRVYDNLQKRSQASQQSLDQSRQQLEYLYKYQSGLRTLDAGTAAAYETAIGDFDKSLAAKADFLPALAKKAELLALLAAEYEKTERVSEACQLADRALAAGPKAPAAIRAKAACLLASGKTDEAMKLATQAIAAVEGDQVEDAESNYVLALAYLKSKDISKAVDALKAAIGANPLHFRAHYLLADVFASQKQWQQSLDEITKALQLQPNHQQAKQRQVDYQTQLSGGNREAAAVPGMPQELGADMDKKAKSDKLLADARAAVARGATNEALGLINELLKLGVRAGAAYMLKCKLFVDTHEYQAAIEACGEARDYSADAYYYLGAVYEAQGNTDLSHQNYQAYISARPDGRFADEVRSILGQH